MILEGFVLRKMPGMNLVMPTGSRIKDFKGALMLNDTGAFIFERLQGGKSTDAIVGDLMSEYSVTAEKAREGVENTLSLLKEAGVAI